MSKKNSKFVFFKTARINWKLAVSTFYENEENQR